LGKFQILYPQKHARFRFLTNLIKIAQISYGYGGATQPLSRDGGREEHQEPNSRATPRGQKWKRQYQKWCAGKAQMQDNPGEGESDPAEGVCRHCIKNSPSVLSCIGKRPKDCDCGSKVGTVHSR